MQTGDSLEGACALLFLLLLDEVEVRLVLEVDEMEVRLVLEVDEVVDVVVTGGKVTGCPDFPDFPDFDVVGRVGAFVKVVAVVVYMDMVAVDEGVEAACQSQSIRSR